MTIRLVKRWRLAKGLSLYQSTRLRPPEPSGGTTRDRFWIALIVVFLACLYLARCTGG